jgi:hypothetical protein
MMDGSIQGDVAMPTPEELRAAKLATLDAIPSSPEAEALVDTLVERVLAYRAKQGIRIPTATALQSIRRAVAAFVADFLLNTKADHEPALIYRSMNANSFTDCAVNYRVFKDVVEALTAQGLLEHFRGFYLRQKLYDVELGKSRDIERRARAARFKAKPALYRLCHDHGVRPQDQSHHFHRPPPRELVVLKTASEWFWGRKIKGEIMECPPGRQLDAIKAQVEEINTYLSGVRIEGGNHYAFQRNFSMGDKPGFRWNKGGRLYSAGPNNYQATKKERRIEMRLNGVMVVEIDIEASFLTILHGVRQTPWPLAERADPYAIDGVPREIAKSWLTSSIGSGLVLKRWPKLTAENYQKKTGRELQDDHDVAAVGAAMIDRIPLLGRLDQIGMDWADLMFIESEIMIAAMRQLAEKDIPALPIHDSVLVPGNREGDAVEALQACFEARVGIRPSLKVLRPLDPPHRVCRYQGSMNWTPEQDEPVIDHGLDDEEDDDL